MPDAQELRAPLLQGLAETARRVLGAAAVSVGMRDPGSHEVVFEAASGAGEALMVGARIPGEKGLLGHVLREGALLRVADTGGDPRFAVDIAISSGYEPEAIVAAPIRHRGVVVGVLSVLDPEGDDDATIASLAAHAEAVLVLCERLGDAG